MLRHELLVMSVDSHMFFIIAKTANMSDFYPTMNVQM
jgi:hypothetical protein